MPSILKENRIQNFGPNCILSASFQSIAGIEDEGWTITGSPVIVSTPFGRGMQFDRTVPDYITIPSSPELDFVVAGEMSIEVLLKLNLVGQNQEIVSKRNGANGYMFIIRSTNVIRMSFPWGGYVDSTTPLQVGIWYHIEMTWNNGAILFYVNGAPDGGGAGVGYTDERTADINIARAIGWGPLSADVEFINMYSNAESAADVLARYNNVAGLGTNP